MGVGGRRVFGWFLLVGLCASLLGAWVGPRWSLLPRDLSFTLLVRHQLPLPSAPAPVEAVFFTEPVAAELARTWQVSVHHEVEKVRCLMGRRDGATLVVTELRRPRVAGASPRRVDFFTLPCQVPGFIGTLHTHPSGHCALSAADVASFLGHRTAQVEVVLCEPRRIAWLDKRGAATRVSTVLTVGPSPGAGLLGD